jgi:hypothetical protein
VFEKLSRDKYYSLLRMLVKYGQRGFITLGPPEWFRVLKIGESWAKYVM